MSRFRDALTAERARSILAYDKATGVLTWIAKPGPRAPVIVGAQAGSLHKRSGYMTVQIDGVAYRAHRVAWLIETGAWPSGEIDHRNGRRSDNRWGNLRDLPFGVNQENRTSSQVNSATRLLGVSKNRKGFQATISLRGKNKNLGVFPTAEMAHEAYLSAKRQLHVGCTI